MKNIYRYFALSFIFVSFGLTGAESPMPGSFPPKSVQERVRPILKDIRVAQNKKAHQEVVNLSQQVVEVLGDWAANPNIEPNYYKSKDESKPNKAEIFELWRRIKKKLKKRALWVKVPDGDPNKMTNNLRQAGRPIIAFSHLFSFEPDASKQDLKFIVEGADYLLRLQRKNGLFPSPDLRDDDPYYTTYNKRTLRKNKNAIVDGWFVDDYRGELQFDNAVSAIAMLRVYMLTKDGRYLSSAKKAADWARNKNLDTNWAYNAFSVWLLSEYYQISGEQSYLDAAVEKVRLGVLPGQLQSGRWFDPVTSKLVYHGSIVRSLISLYSQIDKETPFKKELRKSINNAVDNAAEQIVANGASSTSTSTEMLVNALTKIGYNELWVRALNINVNASLNYLTDKKAPWIGVFLSNYIVYQETLEVKKS